MSELAPYKPGDDAKAIADISKAFYGGFEGLFEAHNWPERGSDMMRKVQSRVAEYYGTIQAFDKIHRHENPFDYNPDVMLTSFWGFDPDSWGCVGFTNEGRRNTIVGETSDPFIMVIYVTEKAGEHTPRHMWGKVVGYYEVTHVTGLKAEFMPKWQEERHDPKSWNYSLKASRAWKILPEFMPSIRDFDPTLHAEDRQQTVSKNAEVLKPELIKKLMTLPCEEVEVFGGMREIESIITIPANASKNYVRGGAGRMEGYDVGEPKHTHKELYILQLCGDETGFLGRDAEGKKIIKVGLSISPKTRCGAFQKALPEGAYTWDIIETTLGDGDDYYPDFKTAEAGEMAMKKHLGAIKGSWLGGEFYLADDDKIKRMWKIGRDAAMTKMQDGK